MCAICTLLCFNILLLCPPCKHAGGLEDLNVCIAEDDSRSRTDLQTFHFTLRVFSHYLKLVFYERSWPRRFHSVFDLGFRL